MRTAKTLIWLGGCPGWSESSLGAHAILLVMLCGSSTVEGSNRCQAKLRSSELLPFRALLLYYHTGCFSKVDLPIRLCDRLVSTEWISAIVYSFHDFVLISYWMVSISICQLNLTTWTQLNRVCCFMCICSLHSWKIFFLRVFTELLIIKLTLCEPHHEKTCFMPYANNKGADQAGRIVHLFLLPR